jgi:hypothetical protein
MISSTCLGREAEHDQALGRPELAPVRRWLAERWRGERLRSF